MGSWRSILSETFWSNFKEEVDHQRDKKDVQKENSDEHEVDETTASIAKQFPPNQGVEANSKVAKTFQTLKNNLHKYIIHLVM